MEGGDDTDLILRWAIIHAHLAERENELEPPYDRRFGFKAYSPFLQVSSFQWADKWTIRGRAPGGGPGDYRFLTFAEVVGVLTDPAWRKANGFPPEKEDGNG